MMDREGIVTICKLQNISTPGRMPVDKLVTITTAYYRKRTVGYNRLYAAMGANQSISMLIRCFNIEAPQEPEIYVVSDDGTQFRVSAIQEIVDEGAVDFTLSRLEENYDVVTE